MKREEAINYFAENVRTGKSPRHAHFLSDDDGALEADVTAEVLALAGDETPEETRLRAEEDERRFPTRLGSMIASELDESFSWKSSTWYLGEKFSFAEEDDLIMVRERDGKRYRIEIECFVSEVAP